MKKIRSWLLGLFWWFAVARCTPILAHATDVRGGRVGWARLVTQSGSWSVHQENDSTLAAFIAENTTLNIDPVCYPADSGNLDELCRYPLIFTNNLTNVRDAVRQRNVREYLRRGGFIYIDRCVNLSFSLPTEEFFQRHRDFFAHVMPESTLRELPDGHALYRCYFDVSSDFHPVADGASGSNHSGGLYGVFLEDRMVALLSLASLQCGWPHTPWRRSRDEKLIANIYVYAMTRPTEAPR